MSTWKITRKWHPVCFSLLNVKLTSFSSLRGEFLCHYSFCQCEGKFTFLVIQSIILKLNQYQILLAYVIFSISTKLSLLYKRVHRKKDSNLFQLVRNYTGFTKDFIVRHFQIFALFRLYFCPLLYKRSHHLKSQIFALFM